MRAESSTMNIKTWTTGEERLGGSDEKSQTGIKSTMKVENTVVKVTVHRG